MPRGVADDFVFLDPPYDSEFADYGTVFGANVHRRLAEAFRELPRPALIRITA